MSEASQVYTLRGYRAKESVGKNSVCDFSSRVGDRWSLVPDSAGQSQKGAKETSWGPIRPESHSYRLGVCSSQKLIGIRSALSIQ